MEEKDLMRESVTQDSEAPQKGRRLRGFVPVTIVAAGASLMLLACSTKTISSDRPGSDSAVATSYSQIVSTQTTEAPQTEMATAPAQTETFPTETEASKDRPQSASTETAAAEAASRPKKPSSGPTEPTMPSQAEKPWNAKADTDEDLPGDILKDDPQANPQADPFFLADSDEDLEDDEP